MLSSDSDTFSDLSKSSPHGPELPCVWKDRVRPNALEGSCSELTHHLRDLLTQSQQKYVGVVDCLHLRNGLHHYPKVW